MEVFEGWFSGVLATGVTVAAVTGVEVTVGVASLFRLLKMSVNDF